VIGQEASHAVRSPGLSSSPVDLHPVTGGNDHCFFQARGGAQPLQVSLILWGWALAQYPYLIPPDLTIRAAAAPRITLVLTLWILGGGALVLFPSLIYLFRVFKPGPG
jgi:hypothetical protein